MNYLPTCPECGQSCEFDRGEIGGWDSPPIPAAWYCVNCGIDVNEVPRKSDAGENYEQRTGS